MVRSIDMESNEYVYGMVWVIVMIRAIVRVRVMVLGLWLRMGIV